jgi:hypothetical protein
VEKKTNLLFPRISCFLLIHLIKQIGSDYDGRPLRSSSWTFVLPSLNILHHVRFQVLTAASMMFRAVFWVILPCRMFVDKHSTRQYNSEDSSEHHPTPSSHYSISHSIFSINFTNLSINFSRANIFGIQKFDHWSYLTTGGIFDFHTHFKTKLRTYKQRMRTDNVSDVIFSAPETSPRRRIPLTPPARPVCAIGTYFLDFPDIMPQVGFHTVTAEWARTLPLCYSFSDLIN